MTTTTVRFFVVGKLVTAAEAVLRIEVIGRSCRNQFPAHYPWGRGREYALPESLVVGYVNRYSDTIQGASHYRRSLLSPGSRRSRIVYDAPCYSPLGSAAGSRPLLKLPLSASFFMSGVVFEDGFRENPVHCVYTSFRYVRPTWRVVQYELSTQNSGRPDSWYFDSVR